MSGQSIEPQRFSVKVFAEAGAELPAQQLIPTFHRWIQHKTVAGTLIDVADYAHMKRGPGIMLIAHECDYAIHEGEEGRPGFLYDSKRRGTGPFVDRFRTAMRNALDACAKLEAEPDFAGKARFVGGDVSVTILDRLAVENDEAGFATIRTILTPVLDEVYGAGSYAIARADLAEGEPLTVTVRCASAGGVEALGQRLAA